MGYLSVLKEAELIYFVPTQHHAIISSHGKHKVCIDVEPTISVMDKATFAIYEGRDEYLDVSVLRLKSHGKSITPKIVEEEVGFFEVSPTSDVGKVGRISFQSAQKDALQNVAYASFNTISLLPDDLEDRLKRDLEDISKQKNQSWGFFGW